MGETQKLLGDFIWFKAQKKKDNLAITHICLSKKRLGCELLM